MKEVQKVLEELKGVRPEKLTGEAKRLFEAIMKIADERDEFEYKYNRAIEDLVKLEKERQADKEKIEHKSILNVKLKQYIDEITIGRSVSFPSGWVYKKDLMDLINNIKWEV